MVLTCRFYEQRFPEIDDVVMVNVRSIADMGAYVHLLEYNNIEGMILLSELSRRRIRLEFSQDQCRNVTIIKLIRSINKLIRVGRTEPVVVIRVDKDKGYIDLSKRRVSKEDIERCTEKYSKAKAVNSIVRHVAEILGYKTNDELEQEIRAKLQGARNTWPSASAYPGTQLCSTESLYRCLMISVSLSAFDQPFLSES